MAIGNPDEGHLAAASIEVTPRDATRFAQLADSMPPNMDVFLPFLPLDSMDQRIDAARLLTQHGFRVTAHISTRRLESVAELSNFLDRLTRAGVTRTLLVAGDPAVALGPFPDSQTVIDSRLLEKAGIRHVAIAGHPEGHSHISSQETWRVLEAKIVSLGERGLSTEIVTQFSFDAHRVSEWIDGVRARGIGVPIAIGIPGPASVRTLLGFASRCGVAASSNAIAKYGISLSRLLSKAGPDKFVDALIESMPSGAHPVRAHFYPFGGFADTAAWLRNRSANPPVCAAE